MIERHKKILELIEQNQISTQSELAEMLTGEGFDVTQATVSRDIKQLQLAKKKTEGKSYYIEKPRIVSEDQERYAKLFKESVTSVKSSGNLIVIKTIIGSANSAAMLIDSFEYPEIMGSVAGDDTIITVIESEQKAKKLVLTLSQLLN